MKAAALAGILPALTPEILGVMRERALAGEFLCHAYADATAARHGPGREWGVRADEFASFLRTIGVPTYGSGFLSREEADDEDPVADDDELAPEWVIDLGDDQTARRVAFVDLLRAAYELEVTHVHQ